MQNQAPGAVRSADKPSNLLALARSKFPQTTPAEEKLFRCVAAGETADYKANDPQKDDPANAENWGEDRTLRSELIRWLCTDLEASGLVTTTGIRVLGACFQGAMDLEFAGVFFPLVFLQCAIPQEILLRQAQIRFITLSKSRTGPISADGLKVNGCVVLNGGFEARGEVNLRGADIAGNLDCSGGKFINEGQRGISADGLKVKGDVFLRDGFEAKGAVRLPRASIGGDLDCTGGKLINLGQCALNADGLKVQRYVFLKHDFEANGEVNLLCASIGGDLDCRGGKFINEASYALKASGINVEGGVFLRDGFEARGEVNLLSATIRRNLECTGGKLINEGKVALNGDWLKVEGGVLLRDGFEAKGDVRLGRASIGGDLDCTGGKLLNPGRYALTADGLKAGGGVFLRDGFEAKGEIRLIAATIGLYLACRGVKDPDGMALDLSSAKVGTLEDEQGSWPAKGNLILHGLEYNEIASKSPKDWRSRLDWLQRQAQFSPQPYEKLAEVLRESGHDEDARQILVEKNKGVSRQTNFPSLRWWRYKILGPMIGYGYRPFRAVWWGLGLILFGWVFFGLGYDRHIMLPTSENAYIKQDANPPGQTQTTPNGRSNGQRELSPAYPEFHSLAFSVETVVPLVNLYQAQYWLPRTDSGKWLSGWIWMSVFWLERIAGWILSLLFVAGVTGLLKT